MTDATNPAGYRLLPVEPTDAMRQAAGTAVSGNWRPNDASKGVLIYKAMAAAAPTAPILPPPCDPAIFERGAVVAVMECGMLAMEGLIKEACRYGPAMDWHYVGGRAVVKTLGDVPAARKALERSAPRFLDAAPGRQDDRYPNAEPLLEQLMALCDARHAKLSAAEQELLAPVERTSLEYNTLRSRCADLEQQYHAATAMRRRLMCSIEAAAKFVHTNRSEGANV